MTDQLLRQLFTTGERIDDVARARIWSKLASQLEAPPARRRWVPVAGALAVAAAAVIVLVVAHRGDTEQRLGAPTGTVLTTALGPHAHAALQGPAVLAVAQTGEITRARLEEGTLYAEFTGGPGRALHISAAGTEIEVVGTLFAVEVHDARVCLSVAHGRVRIVAGGVERFVASGGRACASRGAFTDTASIEAATRDALEHHARTWAPDSPPLEAAASPPPAPVPPAPATSQAPALPAARTATTGVVASTSPPAPAPIPSSRAPTSASPAATSASSARGQSTQPAAASTGPIVASTAPAAATTGPAAASPAPVAAATQAPAAAASTPPPANTDAALYREADAALARGDRDAADRALAKLLATSPESPLADEALYERARIAVERRAWSDARAMLARLAEISDTPLAEPGAYLRCRVAVASQEHGVADVLAAYVAAYPDGPHELEVRLQLVGTQVRDGGCRAAAAQLDELQRRHPDDANVAAYRSRCGGDR
jgi:TolA-binding protein